MGGGGYSCNWDPRDLSVELKPERQEEPTMAKCEGEVSRQVDGLENRRKLGVAGAQ